MSSSGTNHITVGAADKAARLVLLLAGTCGEDGDGTHSGGVDLIPGSAVSVLKGNQGWEEGHFYQVVLCSDPKPPRRPQLEKKAMINLQSLKMRQWFTVNESKCSDKDDSSEPIASCLYFLLL